MKRLSRKNLNELRGALSAPRARPPLRTGIVHFGPGAFHRAHQADYLDRLLDRDPQWGIAAVSLRSRGTVQALAEQDGLYTLAIRDRSPDYRVIRAHTAFLRPQDTGATLALLRAPATRLVTSTVTEKGYCFSPDGTLDFTHPDIVHDLSARDTPRSIIGWLCAGLAARREAGCAPFVAMPCDNLADNGPKLRAALIAYAGRYDPALADWIAREVRVPSTMVDAITPASNRVLYADVATAIGLEDRAAVQRECFAQWVIEDVGDLGPDLASVGATVTRDVGGFERAKLRILNGAHSTLAYLGLLRGHVTVADAVADPDLSRFVRAMILEEIISAMRPVAGLDLSAYADQVLARFANSGIAHRLDQIAQDGSQKLPYRLGDTLVAARSAGVMPTRIIEAYAGWVAFVRRQHRSRVTVIDPRAGRMGTLAAGDARTMVRSFIAEGIGLPSAIAEDERAVDALTKALAEHEARTPA